MSKNQTQRLGIFIIVTEAQKRANKKWDEEHKERKAYIAKRSTARNFIKKFATDEDIEELKRLIAEREGK